MAAVNYLELMMEAVENKTAADYNQQYSDAQATQWDTKIEQSIYNYWDKQVSIDAYQVQWYAQQEANSPNNKKYQYDLTKAQAKLQNDETDQQAQTGLAQGATDSMNNQVGQDSSNAQQNTTMAQAINVVAQSLASALAQHY